MSAAERLFDSLRDLLYAWTHRLKPRQAAPEMTAIPRLDLDELIERHEARLTPTSNSSAVPGVRERVTMHDHAVSKLFDRRESVRY